MQIKFYYAPFSSASPVASALIELGVPHERVEFDLSRTDHKQPAYLAINPNGTVPAITVDGTPMFEALAIMTWLGETFGVERGLWPAASDPARLRAWSWCTWAYVTMGSAIQRLHLSSSERADPSLRSEAYANHARGQLRDLFDRLEARLTEHTHLLGDRYSLADLVVASVVGYSLFIGADVSKHPRIAQWLSAFQARESFKQVMG